MEILLPSLDTQMEDHDNSESNSADGSERPDLPDLPSYTDWFNRPIKLSRLTLSKLCRKQQMKLKASQRVIFSERETLSTTEKLLRTDEDSDSQHLVMDLESDRNSDVDMEAEIRAEMKAAALDAVAEANDIAAAIATLNGANGASVQHLNSRSIPATSSNNTGPVTWDKYSPQINGERLFHFSGEFHYYRLPSPSLWLDVLEKMSAAGFTAASIYFNWGYHSAKSSVYDFTGVRDLQKLFQIASEAGIYVTSRAGPYINAEDDGGGFPGCYTEAWEQWLSAIDPYLVAAQITKGGPIILNQVENELGGGQQNYMQSLEYKFREDGLTIPFTFNDVNQGGRYATGTGSVDIYGSDSYPLGFNCANPTRWPSSVPTGFRSFYSRLNLNEPYFLAEYQGGSFDPWGGVGYATCGQLTNEQFAKVYYKNNYAQGITMQSLYITYGGTSWGALAAPVVYTSYDYGAAISEPRTLTAKYYELKLQATFLNTAKPILTTEYFAGNTSNSAIVDSVLQSVGSSNAQFHVLRQSTTSSTAKQTFTVTVNITEGDFTIPNCPILPTGYNTSYHRILYSTSELFSHSVVGSREVAVVYAYQGEYGEIALGGFTAKSKVQAQAYSGNITSNATDTSIQINYQHSGVIPVVVSAHGVPDLLLYVADYYHAALFWAPEVSPGNRVFVYGPWLVRNATLSGSDLYLRGGVNETTSIEVAAPELVKSVYWNGELIRTKKTHYKTLTGTISGPQSMTLPDLATAQWRYGWASPESVPTFNDSAWTVCNNNSVDPINSILDADTYGYHSGTGASNTNYFNFTSIDNSTNVVSLLVFTTGHDESEGGNFYNYRGLGSAHLIGSQNKITWKVQGNNGGEDILDTVRGPLNEGGLYGERAGWHMPGFPIPSDWPTVTLPYNFATPQVVWFITTFDLNVPKGVDQPIGVQVTDSSRKPYRALLFLNGWQFGRYANDLGPQTLFYVPEGILNYAGNNTIVVVVMSLDSSAVIAPKITLSTIDITTTDIAVSLVDSPAYTPRAGYGSGTIPSKPPAPSPIPTAQNSTAAGCPYTGIVDISLTYTITVGGVNGCGTVYNYLSGYICDNTYPYGQNGVDFWSADDGSGRQRWNFVEVPGKVNTYNVIVNGRAGCNTTYLSSVP
ncbi:hypothetical protein BZG36_04824, partial [Bifiguratus adelaidae]